MQIQVNLPAMFQLQNTEIFSFMRALFQRCRANCTGQQCSSASQQLISCQKYHFFSNTNAKLVAQQRFT